MTDEYRLYVPSTQWVLFSLPFVLFLVVGVSLFLRPLDTAQELPFAAAFLAVFGFLVFQVLWLPYRIEVDQAGRITFVSLARKRRLASGEIQSIRPQGVQLGFLIVRHAGGRTRLLAQFDDFHHFLAGLEDRNPQVDIRGC